MARGLRLAPLARLDGSLLAGDDREDLRDELARGLLAEARVAETATSLLEEDVEPEVRHTVIEDLTDHGDADARLEVLQDLQARLQAGEQLERPHWPSTELTVASAELADGALTVGKEDLAGFAMAQLQAQASEQALAALAMVVNNHRGTRPWLAASVEQMAGRIATRLVLERLPEDLGEIAVEFERVAGAT